MPPLSGFLATLPADVLLDSGVLFIDSDVAFGITRGGLAFDPGIAYENIEFDDKRYPIAGLDRKEGGVPKISGTILELSALRALVLEPAATQSGPASDTLTTPKIAGELLAVGDYLANVRVAYRRGNGKFAIVKFAHAILTKYSKKGNSKGQVEIAIEIEARNNTDTGAAPYEIHLADVTAEGPQDGSLADFDFVFSDAIVGVWDLSDVAKVHVNVSTQIDSVDDARGAGVGLPLIGALADGTLGSWKPGWDAANKRAIFTLGQPTQTRLATALDARYRLNDQSLALIIWGGFNVGSGSYAIRILHNDGLRGTGLSGAFGHPTFDFQLATDATHSYGAFFPQGNSVVPNVAGPVPRTIAMCIKLPPLTPSGFEGSFPLHSIESPGNERVAMLASALNEWTQFIAGTCQIIVGGAVTEGYLRGAALIKLDAFQDKALSRAHMACLERFGTRLGCVSTITAAAKGVTLDGDSRQWGNGAANANTDPVSIQLQGLLGAGYHTQNRGVEGDSWHDRANLNGSRVYPAEWWRQRASNDKDTNRAGPDIHVYLLDVNDTSGPGVGGGFGNTVASADVCLAQFDLEFAAAVADGKRVVVCAPFAPIVDPFRTEWLNGLLARAAANPATLAIARTDLDARLANPSDMTYFTDGLHQTPAGMGVIAQIIHDTIIAKGW